MIRFLKDGIFTDIAITEKDKFNIFQTILKKICILRSFDLDYEILGSKSSFGGCEFSDGYLATSKINLETYHAEVINKNRLSNSGTHHNNFKELVSGIRLLRKANHPSIVRLLEIHETETKVVLVIEKIEASTIMALNNLGKPIADKELVYVMR